MKKERIKGGFYKYKGLWGWKESYSFGDVGFATKEEAKKSKEELEKYIEKKYPTY